jgi:hypothetical protein
MADTDASVVYCDNRPDSPQFCAVFADVVKSLAFRPVHYSGVGGGVRASVVDQRKSLGGPSATTAVLFLGVFGLLFVLVSPGLPSAVPGGGADGPQEEGREPRILFERARAAVARLRLGGT